MRSPEDFHAIDSRRGRADQSSVPEDVLASEVEAEADILVTGDRDLLEIARKAPIEIVDPRGFWDKLRHN